MIVASFAPNGQPDAVRGLLAVLVAVSLGLALVGALVWSATARLRRQGDDGLPAAERYARRCLLAGAAGLVLAVVVGVVHAST